jgi:hypothetical protein
MEKIDWSYVNRAMLVKTLRAFEADYRRAQQETNPECHVAWLQGKHLGAMTMLRLVAPTIAQGIIEESER